MDEKEYMMIKRAMVIMKMGQQRIGLEKVYDDTESVNDKRDGGTDNIVGKSL